MASKSSTRIGKGTRQAGGGRARQAGAATATGEGSIEEVLSGQARWVVARGDSQDVLATLGDRAVDHVLCDPPYSEHVHSKQRRMLRGAGGRAAKRGQGRSGRGQVGEADLGFASLSESLRLAMAAQFARLVKRWVLCFTNAEGQHFWERDLVAAGLRHVRVGAWIKLGCMPQLTGDRPGAGFEAIEIAHPVGACRWNSGGHPGVWHHPVATDRNGSGERVHTTQKPLSLMLELVEDFTLANDIILDPFAGGGSTGVAALRLGRRVILVEKDKTYAKVSRERMRAEEQGLSLGAYRDGQLPMMPLMAGGAEVADV